MFLNILNINEKAIVMNQMEIIKTIIILYVATIIGNIFISAMQYRNHPTKTSKYSLILWSFWGILTLANFLFDDQSFPFLLMASFGLFITQYLLGKLICDIHEVETSLKKVSFFYALTILLSSLLYFQKFHLFIYGTPILIGCLYPLLHAFYFLLKSKKKDFTLIQKFFVAVCCLSTFNHSTSIYVRHSLPFLIPGFMLAFAMMQLLSIIVPIMTNENSFIIRNNQLEDEIKTKAEEIVQMTEKLWESNKMSALGQMAAGVAHEINNPLMIIKLQTEVLLKHSEKDNLSKDVLNQSLTKISNVVDRISKITTSLRIFARSGKTSPQTVIDVQTIISDTLSLCFDRMNSLGVRFTKIGLEQNYNIKANAIEISQVILNLLNNSIDAIEDLNERFISLELKNEEKNLILLITDSGFLSPEINQKIMEPFFTTKAVGKGTGLGLSISKTIIENHGGTLTLNSHSKNTQFKIQLPLC